MNTVIQRSGSCSLSIDFRSSCAWDKQFEDISFLPRIKEISVDDRMVHNLQLSAPWASGLEILRVCGDEDFETLTMHSGSGDYIARVNEQHLPNLPFYSYILNLCSLKSPNLRYLSLTNCCISMEGFPNLEHLEIYHGPCDRDHHFVSSWASIIRCLPRLKVFSIDRAMKWDTSCRNLLAATPPVTQLHDLRINRCSPACATLLRIFSPQPRSLQLTFTDLHYDEEFKLFCDALQAWFRAWEADTPNMYLYVSIQPEGIIVHNRSTRTRQECTTDAESSPSLQLVLYWNGCGLDLISALLNSVSTLEPHPDSAFYSLASPLTRGCEELELSVGLFNYEDEAFRSVVVEFLSRFGDVKKLTCIGDAAAMLTSLSSKERQAGDVTLFLLLKDLCFDHVNFKDRLRKKVTDFLQHLCQPVGNVVLSGCHNVSQSFITSLGCTCAKVVLSNDTVIVDGDCRGNVKVERVPWTKDQVKVSLT